MAGRPFGRRVKGLARGTARGNAVTSDPSAEGPSGLPSDRPRTAWSLLKCMAGLLRRHGLRLGGFAVVFALVIGIGSWVAAVLVAVVLRIGHELGIERLALLRSFYLFGGVLGALLFGPLHGGYWLAVHRLLGGETAGVRTLFWGYARLKRFLNLAAVSAIVGVAYMALRWIWAHLPWDIAWAYVDNLVDPESPVSRLFWGIPGIHWFLGRVHACAQRLLLLPIAWAVAEVAIGGKAWTAALAGSVRLVWRHRRPALVAFAVVVAMEFAGGLRLLVPDSHGHFGAAGWAMNALHLAGHGLITVVGLVMEAVALVVVYREFLRRETDRASASLPDSAAPA